MKYLGTSDKLLLFSAQMFITLILIAIPYFLSFQSMLLIIPQFLS